MRSGIRGRLGVVFAACLAVGSSISPSGAATPTARLPRVGAAAFWSAPASNIRDGRAWYFVSVARGGYRLRVSVTRPSCCDYAELELRSPRGATYQTQVGYMSAELFATMPVPGTWVVRISTGDQSLRDYKFRARLEPWPARASARRQTLLPNLRLVPPYEFTFHSPQEVTMGPRPPALSSTRYTDSCSPDDVAQTTLQAMPARRCLRFSVGPANVGAGPFQVRFAGEQGLAVTGTAMQRIYSSDGSFTERAAGTYLYHETHRHYHHTGMGSLELYRVANPRTGSMVKAGAGPKQGFCTADVVIAQWRSFTAAPRGSTASTCASDMMEYGTYLPDGTVMGISPGWADIYIWYQDGNFIDFGTNPDGLYVVRSTTDAQGVILESNERDNTSYAYIEVTGNRVRVLERGFGQSPWDRSKQPAGDFLRSNPLGYA